MEEQEKGCLVDFFLLVGFFFLRLSVGKFLKHTHPKYFNSSPKITHNQIKKLISEYSDYLNILKIRIF